MVKLFTAKGKDYHGCTEPMTMNPIQMGLENGIQFKSYTPDYDRAEIKSFKEARFREWNRKLKEEYITVLLWQGKSQKITLVQEDYANQKVIGALVWKHSDAMDYFKEDKPSRFLKVKASEYLEKLLTGSYKNHTDGILAKLNNKLWCVEIVSSTGRRVFKLTDVLEHKASDVLNRQIERLQREGEL